ncbi:MAG: pyridoxal-phosphate dependent enzyme [Xanthomonadales bacterium]|nr:pyridoxal-phosphate dependent enzyme [Xanthomonadales bacterium]
MNEVHSARERLQTLAIRTPLVRLNVENAPAEIYLKMENLQPIGSFKIRPAGSAVLSATKEQLAQGVYTASSGNMAQGVAYAAKQLGIEATVLLPFDAARNKLAALERLNAKIRFLPDDEWWQVINQHGHPDIPGKFIHPVASQDVLAGDATVGLEIFEDLPDVDTVLVPFGGGGLACGIASAFRGMKTNVKVMGSESEHCAPLTAALAAGHPVQMPIPRTFISGIGVGTVLDQMWPLVKELIDGAVVASVHDISDTIRILFERHRVIVEGAGAAPIAAALAGKGGSGKVVCVISGGNLESEFLIDILRGKMPQI